MASPTDFYAQLFNTNTLFKITDSQTDALEKISASTSVIVVLPSLILSNENGSQLNKILAACNLTNDQVCLLDTQSQWQHIRDHSSIKYVILFGVTGQEFGVNVNFPYHIPIQFDETTWIASSNIETMQTQPHLKAELWNKALKPIFVK